MLMNKFFFFKYSIKDTYKFLKIYLLTKYDFMAVLVWIIYIQKRIYKDINPVKVKEMMKTGFEPQGLENKFKVHTNWATRHFHKQIIA